MTSQWSRKVVRRVVTLALFSAVVGLGAQAHAAPPRRGGGIGPQAPDPSRPALRPIVECVKETAPGAFAAHFGYESEALGPMSLPVGSANGVSPEPVDRGQPTVFAPGRTARYPRAPFQVAFDGRPLTWTIVGLDGQTRSATASTASRRCAPVVDSLAPRVQILEPRARGTVATLTPRLVVAYDDDGAVDLTTVQIRIDGVDRTSWFTVGPREAVSDPSRRLESGLHEIEATVSDDAGREGRAGITFSVDVAPPELAIAEPGNGAFVSGASVDVTGYVRDASAVTVTVAGTDAVVRGTSFRATGVALGPDGEQKLLVSARDSAGNTSRETVTLRVTRKALDLRVLTPVAGARVSGPVVRVTGAVGGGAREKVLSVDVNSVPAIVQGDSFTADLPVADGPLALVATARSVAGVVSTQTVRVVVDSTGPVVTVTSPSRGAVTRERSLRVTGRVCDRVVEVRVAGQLARIEAGGFAADVPLPSEGPQTVLVEGRDGAGRPQTAPVAVRVDRTAPSLRVLGARETAPGRVSVTGTVEDAGAVIVEVNGILAERLDRGWRVDLPDLEAGRHLVSVVARDEAGNESRSTEVVLVGADPAPVVLESLSGPLERSAAAASPSKPSLDVQVAEMSGPTGGAVAGQVVSDLTSLPIPGATVRLVTTGEMALTDEKGTYALGVTPGAVLLQIEKAGMTDAERTVSVVPGTGVVAVDARLAPLSAATTIDSSGGTLHAEFARRLRPETQSPSSLSTTTLALEVPPGAVSESTDLTLTPLSPQGLPALLPLGASPVAAFAFEGPGPMAGANGHFAGLPAMELHLTTYDRTLHAWTLVAASLVATDGVLDVTIPRTGTWALIALDPSVPTMDLPAPGAVLPAAAFQPIPADATGTTLADPPSLPSSGGVSRGRLVVATVGPLPSGTVVQAILTEEFTLVSGEIASGEERYEDLVLYRADAEGFTPSEDAGQIALAAEVPIAPSREFGSAELAEGRIRLAIQAGREGVRDVGGAGAVIVTSGDVALSIPAGATASETVVSLRLADRPSSALPSVPGVTPRLELQLDLSGATLTMPAELSLPAALAPVGGSLFVARVEWMGDATRLRVVARAERVGSRIVTQPHSALPGLRQGGRYVVIHAVPAVGFLAGTVRAADQARPALVTTSGLPFAWAAGNDGAYVVLTLAGAVRAEARVLGTSLIGTADASVASGSVTTRDIELAQAVATATVSPADGEVAVPPTRQIEIETSVPLDPASAIADHAHLRHTTSGQVVAVRTVLSASGLRLAVIPQTTLAFATQYTFDASGLLDATGGAVAVPSVTFTTAPQATHALDLDSLRFSFPVDGEVTMSAPAGALPSGTEILVLNISNGQILTYRVGDLPVEAPLLASIDDRLWVTVTDPDGRQTTFERTEYVAPDGKTAVGAAGGTVRGPDGSELRLPDGATDKAVTLKISPLRESDLPSGTSPDLPGARFGGGIAIESADRPAFKKEVDLVFPRPANAPEGSFFYVYRKIDLPGGRVSFQTLDQAFAEGDKVVTASPPFLGYVDSLGSFAGIGAGLQSTLTNHLILMWTHDEFLPARSAAGVITGRVLQAETANGEVVYTPIPGAIVTGLNAAGYSLLEDPASNSVSSTTTDPGTGTFALIDARYTGGLVGVSVLAPDGRTKIGTAYQSNPMDAENYSLRFFQNVARLTVTFEGLEVDSTPASVSMKVVRQDDGRRHDTDGLIVEGSNLLVGIRNRNAAIANVSIGGIALGFEPDTASASDPLAFDLVTSSPFVASPPGTYVVEVQARDADTDETLPTVTQTFRVVPAGGGHDEADMTSPPRVLEARSFPAPGAKRVPVTSVPFVVFSEPVRNLPGNVTLVECDDDGTERPKSVRLIGVIPGSAEPAHITSPSQAVVSLTIQPLPGLDYDKTYRIVLRGRTEQQEGIVDLDELSIASSKPLEDHSIEFETVALPPATGRDSFASPGVVVQDGFAYLVQNELTRGILKVYDVRNPLAPLPVPSADRFIANRPIDLVGRSGQVIVGTTATNRSVPSNLHVFDTTQPADPRWVGVASVSNGVVDGLLVRHVVRGNYAYALTQRKGLQTVDLRRAEANFAQTGGVGNLAYTLMEMALSTDGQGFGQDAVVSTIPLPVNSSVSWRPFDLDVGAYPLSGRMKPVAFIAAQDDMAQQCSLVVGSPEAAAVVKQANLTAADGTDLCPVRVALGRAEGREVAVLGVALGKTLYSAEGFGVAVVDVSDPSQPELLGYIPVDLPDISDLVLDGELAFVASAQSGTEIVSIKSPSVPYSAGHIEGLAGRLAVGEGGNVFSSGGSYGDSPVGGIHVATLDPQCNLLSLRHERLLLDALRDPEDGSLCPGSDAVVLDVCQDAAVTLRIDGRVPSLSIDGEPPREVSEVPLAPGTHVIRVPFGTIGPGMDTERPFTVLARSLTDPEDQVERQGTMANHLRNRSVLPVGRTFVKGVDLLDGHLVRQANDLHIQGRHLSLDVTRTYSSAARGEDGTMGAGWGWNYSAAAAPADCSETCGVVHVSTADGGGQTFRTTDGGATFTPQRGYHTKLEKHLDGSYEFTDKAHVRHFYREPVDPQRREGALRLERSVDPHGDRIDIGYDLLGRVASVREVLRGERVVRELSVRYTRAGGFDRIESIESNLGHRVDYAYDEHGNLVSVKRQGQNVDGGPAAEPTAEEYEYSISSLRDRHQMTAAVGPNAATREAVGDRTEYRYYGPEDVVPGVGAAALLISNQEEMVKAVVEYPDETTAYETSFTYDFTQMPEYTSTVTDALDHTVTYALNRNGSPREIREPLGRVTEMQWDENGILKTLERDALGRVTHYDHDANGNVTLEGIEKDGQDLAETQYTYDLTFNKLKEKTDAEGRKTRYEIDPNTGDVTDVYDPLSNHAHYEYDADGRLIESRDPRNFITRYDDFNDFGSARAITKPLGHITHRSYDSRNRLTREVQEPNGREVSVVYDGFDRPVTKTRRSGQSGSDEVTETEYYPGGQTKAVTNSLGGRTEYDLDGLNRVVETRTAVSQDETLVTTQDYDGNGNKVVETDAREITRQHTFDALNRLIGTEILSGVPGEGPLHQIAAYGYDLAGNKTSETDLNGITTEFAYDGLYRVERKILPIPKASGGRYDEQYAYDKVGNRTRVTDANGKVTTTEFDDLDRVTQVMRDVGGLNLVTTTSYQDPEGSHVNRSEERDVTRGLRTTFLYDELNRETSRTVHLDGEGSSGEEYITRTDYQDDLHAVRVTNPRDVATLRRLDGLDRVIEETVDVPLASGGSGLALTTTVTYDGMGNKKTITDPEGRLTHNDYDYLGRLVKSRDAKHQETTFTYYGDGLKATTTDRRAIKTEYTYDNVGRPRTTRLESAPLSGVAWSQETTYIPGPQPKRVEKDARGHETVLELDALGRVVKELDALGHYRTFGWDGVNKLEETDKRPEHYRTVYEYDGINRLTTTKDPLQREVTVQYEDAHNRVTEKDRRGFLKVTQSDPLGRVLTVTHAAGTPDEAVLETNTYDAIGNKVTAIDAEGRETHFVYDAANRLTSRTDGFGTAEAGVTSYVYDKAGNLLEERDARAAANGEVWSAKRTYDELNRPVSEMDGEGHSTAFAYDEEGNRTSVEAPLGGLEEFFYDELGKLTKVRQPTVAAGTPETSYVYDEARNRVRHTDARGKITTYEYDELNRLETTTQDPGGLALITQVARYDANGNPEIVVDPKGQTTESTFDELGRVATRTFDLVAGDPIPWRHTTEVRYTYDANGNLLSQRETVAGSPDAVTSRAYDGLNRLVSETQPLTEGSTASGTVSYAYYDDGLRKTVADPAGRVTSYTYDGKNRVATITVDSKTTTYGYWPDDLLRTVAYDNGVVATHTYDRADRLLSLTNSDISSFFYTYDDNGNRLSQVETNGGITESTSYSFDALDRLASIIYPVDAAYPQGRVVSYEYDTVGNRTRETDRDAGGVVLADKQGVFDNLNRLTLLEDLVTPSNDTTFTWDANGNTLTKTQNGTTTSYWYDTRDKLVEVTQGASTLGRFTYDAEGRRRLKIGEDGLRQYIYDQTSLFAEYDEVGNEKARYQYGADRLVSLYRSDEGRQYFSLDGLRSVVNLTTDTGATTASYHLDTWGNFRFPSELTDSKNRFGFTGHIWDAETGLYNAKARYYDPKLGRFLTQDSYLGQIDNPPSLHRYFYANDNPVRYVDPTGHKTRTENPGYLDNVIDASTGDRVQGPSLAMDEEISVRAIPTPEDIQQLEANGQISRSEAIMRGVGANPVLQVPAEDPEFMKSSERLYWEAGAKSLASDATVPMQRMMNGAYTNNAGEFAIGAGETVVGAGGGVLLGKGLGAGAGALANRVPLLRRPLTASTRLNPETPLGGLGRSGAPKARVLKESTTTTDPTPEADPAVPAPKSKTKVVVRGTATYEVDEAGLTVSARGRISGPHRGRPKGRLPEPEGGRAPGEHRGHLIPEGGVDAPADVNVVENIISEAPGSNLGPKKSFDLRASKLARENSNATVETTHTPHRQTGSTRPDAVTHSIVVDGQTVHTVTIPNE